MMKAVSIALALLASGSTISQTCNYRVREKDTFSGKERVVVRAAFSFGLHSGFWFEFRRVGDNQYLDMNWSGGGTASISKDALLMLKLEDGTVVELPCNEFELFQSVVTSATITHHVTPTYLMTEDQLRILSGKNITDIRIHTTEGYYDYSLADKAKAARKIREAAACQLATMTQ